MHFLLGGRGSYSDIGGPVITTQVTIPKDVSKASVHTQTHTHARLLQLRVKVNLFVWLLCSWLAPSSVRVARESSRSAMSRGHLSRLMNHWRAPRTASSPSQEHRTRSRTPSTCCRTGMCFCAFLQKYFTSSEWSCVGSSGLDRSK